jgi:hypothetical protein
MGIKIGWGFVDDGVEGGGGLEGNRNFGSHGSHLLYLYEKCQQPICPESTKTRKPRAERTRRSRVSAALGYDATHYSVALKGQNKDMRNCFSLSGRRSRLPIKPRATLKRFTFFALPWAFLLKPFRLEG